MRGCSLESCVSSNRQSWSSSRGDTFSRAGEDLDEGDAVLGHLLDPVDGWSPSCCSFRLLWPPGQCMQHRVHFSFCWYVREEDSFLVIVARFLDQSIDCPRDAMLNHLFVYISFPSDTSVFMIRVKIWLLTWIAGRGGTAAGIDRPQGADFFVSDYGGNSRLSISMFTVYKRLILFFFLWIHLFNNYICFN